MRPIKADMRFTFTNVEILEEYCGMFYFNCCYIDTDAKINRLAIIRNEFGWIELRVYIGENECDFIDICHNAIDIYDDELTIICPFQSDFTDIIYELPYSSSQQKIKDFLNKLKEMAENVVHLKNIIYELYERMRNGPKLKHVQAPITSPQLQDDIANILIVI